MKILTPPRAPQQPEWPKMGVRVKIWDVLMYDDFLYNIFEFLNFFSRSLGHPGADQTSGVPQGYAPP